jgi:SWI/SNF-related matrix-associated actin-dependent regulator 1 of chromatin subfamily A
VSGYPLEALLALRRRAEDAARADLAAGLAAEASARERREVAGAALAAHRARTPGVTGAAEAGVLQLAALHAARHRREEAALAATLAAEEARAAATEASLRERRRALSRARAALRSVERHRDGWEAEERRRRERAEDDAREDAAQAIFARERG